MYRILALLRGVLARLETPEGGLSLLEAAVLLSVVALACTGGLVLLFAQCDPVGSIAASSGC